MAKKSLKQQSHDIQKAFLSLHTADEVFAFLRDLCTTDEIQEFVQRFAIAELLVQKKSYKEIEKIT
jgi:TrpR-related protein YerC/YecD